MYLSSYRKNLILIKKSIKKYKIRAKIEKMKKKKTEIY